MNATDSSTPLISDVSSSGIILNASPSPQIRESPPDAESEEAVYDRDPNDFARQIMSLMTPVSLCLFAVVLLVRSVGISDSGGGFSEVMVYKENSDDSGGTKFGGVLLNMVVFIAVIFVITTLMVICYKYGCTKFIYGWLILSCASLLGLFTMILAIELIDIYNVVLDQISFYFLLWNFAVVGVLGIFWHAPLVLKQAYLIVMSAMMAWTLTKLPEWTTWGILTGVSLWDLFAVLSPVGPLKALLKESHARNDPIPGLIYETSQSSAVETATRQVRLRQTAYGATDVAIVEQQEPSRVAVLSPEAKPVTTDSDSAQPQSHSTTQRLEHPSPSHKPVHPHPEELNEGGESGAHEAVTRQHRAQVNPMVDLAAECEDGQHEEYYEEHEDTVKLGLGDFIFYSVLIARAAMLDTWPTIVACYFALVTGLCLTLFFLALLEKPLPALPISIGLGIIFYFATSQIVDPFLAVLLENQVFV